MHASGVCGPGSIPGSPTNNMKKLWFKNKTYGWGWTPARWEGWAVLALYFVVIIFFFLKIDSASHSSSDTLYGLVIPYIVSTVALIGICFLTGEKPEWRWGKKKIDE